MCSTCMSTFCWTISTAYGAAGRNVGMGYERVDCNCRAYDRVRTQDVSEGKILMFHFRDRWHEPYGRLPIFVLRRVRTCKLTCSHPSLNLFPNHNFFQKDRGSENPSQTGLTGLSGQPSKRVTHVTAAQSEDISTPPLLKTPQFESGNTAGCMRVQGQTQRIVCNLSLFSIPARDTSPWCS
jgi:hypothetical protein